MKEWTRKEKYRKLEEVSMEEMEAISKQAGNSIYRQKFHIQPPSGLLNDPNGFSFFNKEYHLFYQWFPLGPVHGLKYWKHLSSKDLVLWKDLGIAMAPDTVNDSHGVYSGTALEKDGWLLLFYTGNVREADWTRKPKQCMACMDKNNIVEKYKVPFIEEVPKGYTEHFRDPKVIKEGNVYYCILGAQRISLEGTLVCYHSYDLKRWEFLGEVETGLEKDCYMMECPDYFEMGGQDVLIICPQGMERKGNLYQNRHQCGYMKAAHSASHCLTRKFSGFRELDRGFEFYAAQTMMDDKGRRILIAWMGLPDVPCPTEESMWAHCMTLPREIRIINGMIVQSPVEELKKLRCNKRTVRIKLKNEEKSDSSIRGTVYEMECAFSNIQADEVGIKLRTSETEEIVLAYDMKKGEIFLDRSKSGKLAAKEYGNRRSFLYRGQKVKFRIFMDVSSVEIFVNDGEEVFTARIYPSASSEGIVFYAHGSGDLNLDMWSLKI